MNSEEQLVNLMVQYQAGRADSFEELYRLVKPGLYRYLLVKTLDRQLSEELLQETFLQIHRSRRTYLPGRPVTPWIFSIARHVYLTDRRARIKKGNRDLSIENHISDFPVPSNIEASAEIEGLRDALARLSHEHRESLLLHHYWGFSFREIGATLGIRAGTAKLRAHRGLQKLREHLNLEKVTKIADPANEPIDAPDSQSED